MSARFGWCLNCTPDHQSRYCHLCRINHTSSFGVTSQCTCPHHQDQED